MTGCGPSDRKKQPRSLPGQSGEADNPGNSIKQDLRALIDILDQQLLGQVAPLPSLQTARAMAERALRLAELLGNAEPRGPNDR